MKEKRLRLDIAQGIQESETRVDRENGIIYGFAVVSKGATNDKRGEFDDEGLESVVDFGNKSKIGIKSRFGHPNMSNTALGTFLGRVKNFRKDENIVRGDLYIDKTAYKTPEGDLASYVMDLASSDPDAFGSSMVIEANFVSRLNEDGTPAKDEESGETLLPLIRVKKLRTVDIVDDPAANKGMFGNFFSEGVKPSAEMTNFLDKFLDNTEAVKKTMSFLERYANNKEGLARGEGQGVGGEKQGDGGTDNCVCPKCNYKAKHERGTPCNEMKCPKCGASMVGESASNTKKLDKKNNAEYTNNQNLIKGGDTVDTIEALEAQIATLTAEKKTLADELAVKKDAADKESLKTQIAVLEGKIGDAESLKTTITDLETKLGDAEGKVTKLESDKLALAKQERDNKIDSYLEKAKKEGRILPAWETSLKSLLTSLNCEAADFAIKDKDDKEIKVTQEAMLLSILDNMPKIVDFKEKVVDGEDFKSDTKIVNKENLEVKNEELAAKAEKYAKEHKVSYEDALIEVGKQS